MKSFDFTSMLPRELREEFVASAELERERLAHMATCTLPRCAPCRRIGCSAPTCHELATSDGMCPHHFAARIEHDRRAEIHGLIVAAMPPLFTDVRLSDAWLRRLVGARAIQSATTAARSGWAVIEAARSGAGKTSLAAAMVIERGKPGLVWTTARQVASAGAYSKLGEEPALLIACRRASLLVIDEFGTEADRFGASVADVLFDRFDDARDTWLTTPLTEAQMSARYGAGLTRRLGEVAEAIRPGAT